MPYVSQNPATGEIVKTYPEHSDYQIEQALALAGRGFAEWRRMPMMERGRLLVRVADALENKAQDFADLMAGEMGKPVTEGEAEVKKCAWVCRHYAERAEEYLATHPAPSDASESYVRFEPLGAILAIMPWNFPFWQVYRFAAPALMAGNVVILKHAPNSPECALAIEKLMSDCGLSRGVFQSLFLTNGQAAAVISDERVAGVTLTGSARAGAQVGSIAGRSLKKMVLELGGSDPFIVFEDADVEEAAKVGAAARCLNGGQSCIAAKRFLIHSAVAEKFAAAFVAAMKARVVGDPLKRETAIGPMARRDLREALHDQVRRSVELGATILCGGAIPEGPGYFYPPTVLGNVSKGMPAFDEEIFGPVAGIITFDTEPNAIAIANDSIYGLGASVWTGDRERARRVASQIDSGSVFVNGMVKSDPRLPFGGIKQSGFGRELSREGMLEFMNVKTVWIK